MKELNILGRYSEEDRGKVIPEVNGLYINLSQLRRNYEIARSLIKSGTKLMAVLKGNAYGHGLVPVAMELKDRCNAFGVVRLSEALVLRKANIEIPILILSPILEEQVSLVIDNNVTPMVDNEEIVKRVNEYAREHNITVNIHVKINTGLNRYGVGPENAAAFIRKISEKYHHVFVEGVYTQFRDAENNPEFTYRQIGIFKQIIDRLEKENLRPPVVHAANTAGAINYPEAHFDMVRCGMLLYGLEHKPGEKKMPEGIKPLVTLKGRILKIKTIRAGEACGYGDTFIANKETTVAAVSLGYGDGTSLGWKEVLIQGGKVPVINYCMDVLLVDISSIPDAREFDEAVIIGQQGNSSISLLEACGPIGSYPEEQIQRIGGRVPRYYFYDI